MKMLLFHLVSIGLSCQKSGCGLGHLLKWDRQISVVVKSSFWLRVLAEVKLYLHSCFYQLWFRFQRRAVGLFRSPVLQPSSTGSPSSSELVSFLSPHIWKSSALNHPAAVGCPAMCMSHRESSEWRYRPMQNKINWQIGAKVFVQQNLSGLRTDAASCRLHDVSYAVI